MFEENNANSIDSNEAGLLSAIWILACNDENPIMTYRSISYRLGLPEDFDVKTFIKKRSELFRPGVPPVRLDEWKSRMLSGAGRPAWIKEIKDDEERRKAIESLTRDDVFRSQFRAKKDAPQSPVELIDWGLQHIERLRKADVEKQEIRWKWLKDGLIPIASIIIALGTVGITSYFQYQNIQTQKQLKEYELSFKPKQEGYARYMMSFGTLYNLAAKNSAAEGKDNSQILGEFQKFDAAFFEVEPFLSRESKEEIWAKHGEYEAFLTRINDSNGVEASKEKKEETAVEVLKYKDYFREKLNKELFNETLVNK